MINLQSNLTTVISSFTYVYDSANNRTQVTENNGDVVNWTYDAANKLTQEQRNGANAYNNQYTYDGAGNRLTMVNSAGTTNYVYDAANELTSSTALGSVVTTYTYDNNRNTLTQNVGGTITSYTWNFDNRVVQATLPSTAINTYVYDGLGLRRQSQHQGQRPTSSGTGRTCFLRRTGVATRRQSTLRRPVDTAV